MFRGQSTQKYIQNKKDNIQTDEIKSQNIQALSKLKQEPSIMNVKFGNEIVFTFINPQPNRRQFFDWLWKDDSTLKIKQTPQSPSNSIHTTPTQQYTIGNSIKQQNKVKKLQKNYQCSQKKIQDNLYCQDQIVDFKKSLETQYKGLLSKTTDNDITLGIPVIIKFKCKSNNICPFYHTLQYFREQNQKVYYKHKIYCSQHTPQCTLDEQNIKYNSTARKIDNHMIFLEEIINQDWTIKPKQILQLFAKKLGENDQNFLYQGLNSKNVRRSIKKYFDNAVAKVKGRLRQG